ncbi:accessory Sec system translocase SecA2 [Microlunatus speluncae]|uniref:accessory Sec system translocase SecA2 n=1 Tax=Microlunatus speluncae TaxID=2594267 RepID=UPI001C2D5C48|nr:accessory Sec system translocase SecA2 [Microlunatus speluncae]
MALFGGSGRIQTLRRSFARWIGRPGTHQLHGYGEPVEQAGTLEDELTGLDDEALLQRCARIRDEQKVAGPSELAALGREAARRALGERAYDVQLQGVAALLAPLGGKPGIVVELATGEGKTLVGAIAAAGYVLSGQRVQVLSVNDYLARRDAAWMGPVLTRLGVTVGWVEQGSTPDERRAAYAADVCYVSVTEAGFDLLRDRMRTADGDRVQTAPEVAIIDEADSVLIDEARVPLVLAGEAGAGDDLAAAAELVAALRPNEDYEADRDGRTVSLTDPGIHRVEQLSGVPDLFTDGELLTRVNVALYARALVRRDVDYLVVDDTVRLIDPDRGRVARLRRWPDGLHAAVEAKEGVRQSERGVVLDQVTVHELIKRYPVITGMTGTAVSAAEQLREFYQLETGSLPTHRPGIRIDDADQGYDDLAAKEAAIVDRVITEHEAGRPVLLGTSDVAESERIADRLRDHEIDAAVLNARDDAREAEIIAGAGAYGAVTVSTQMAGRGTDIRLGGADETDRDRVAELGGLLVIGTGRYPSRRLDDQLRGRAGRQGDPGQSVFFVSDTDPLIVRGGDGLTAGDVEHAQRVAEGEAAELRRITWQYSQQLQAQRQQVLDYRERLLTTDLAVEQLAEAGAERWAELPETITVEVRAEAARQLLLACLDRRWSDHLALSEHVREGIHFRSIGRENPLYAYNRELADAYRGFADGVLDDAVEALADAVITEDGIELGAAAGRPSATWTYLVSDNPFGTPEDQLLAAVGRTLKRVVNPAG